MKQKLLFDPLTNSIPRMVLPLLFFSEEDEEEEDVVLIRGRGDLVSSRSRLEMKGLKRSIKAGERSRERKRRRKWSWPWRG